MTQGTVKVRFGRRKQKKKDAAVAKPAKDSFDTLGFLAKVGTGKTILKFRKNENVFAQGDVADTVIYVQRGKVKLTVLSEPGKEAAVAILEPGHLFAQASLNAHRPTIATTPPPPP